MKKVILALSIAMIAFTSCKKDDDTPPVGDQKTLNVDQPDRNTTIWAYISLSSGTIVGSAAESESATWAARTDWDFAVRRYQIRTNSGTSSTARAKGGVYTFVEGVTYASIVSVPVDAAFVADVSVTSSVMNPDHDENDPNSPSSIEVTLNKSEAVTMVMKKDPETGSTIMPPVYLAPPVYLFRTADGEREFKVNFTDYLNDEGKSGYVKFQFAEIN